MNSIQFARSIAFLGLAAAAKADIRTIHVDASSPAGGNGESWTSAFSNLQTAFDSLGNIPWWELRHTDVIFKLAGGTYRPTERRPVAFLCNVAAASAASISILGGYAGIASPTPDMRDFVSIQTILTADVNADDGPNWSNTSDNCQTVLCARDDDSQYRITRTFIVEGLTLTGGNTQIPRGAAFLGASNPLSGGSGYTYETHYLFVDCTIRDNQGGAIASDTNDNHPVIFSMTRCTFTHNRSFSAGAALAMDSLDYPLLNQCTFENNSAFEGGAIEFVSNLDAVQCTFASNSATLSGGAVKQRSNGTRGNFLSCLFTANLCGSYGGALSVSGSTLKLCTIVHNTARWGGGVYTADSTSIYDSIFALNSASQAGAQIAGGASLPVLHRVAAEGFAEATYFPFATDLPQIGEQILPFTVAFLNPSGPDNNPATWRDNNYRLPPRSPLIDRAWSSVWGNDLDNVPRVVEGVQGRGEFADLGCYESQLSLCPADLTADQAVTIDDLLDFLAHFELGQPLADLTTNGSTPFPDGGVTIDDLLFFLLKFEQGC